MSNHTQTGTPETPKLSQADSARRNGALSNGPKTENGLANSANARLKHGAYSKRILMDGESPEGYELFKSNFMTLFLPIDTFETECVESMVTARWRIRRLESTEASNLNIALDTNKEKVAEAFDALDIVHERAIAVQDQMSAIDANTRVQERLHRIYDRSFRLLANYRKECGRKIPAPRSGDSASAEDAILTDDPTETAAGHVAPSLVTKTALFLVIFALLFLASGTSSSKPFQSIATASALK
jgi:hypothetical protein